MPGPGRAIHLPLLTAGAVLARAAGPGQDRLATPGRREAAASLRQTLRPARTNRAWPAGLRDAENAFRFADPLTTGIGVNCRPARRVGLADVVDRVIDEHHIGPAIQTDPEALRRDVEELRLVLLRTNVS